MDNKDHPKKITTIARKNLSICLAILIAATLGVWTGCHQDPLPGKLAGAWTSPDPRFEGRVLTISPKSVEITIHGESAALYHIAKVSVVIESRLVRVMLSLEDMQHTASRMTLNYDRQRDTLWIENRPDTIWHRAAV